MKIVFSQIENKPIKLSELKTGDVFQILYNAAIKLGWHRPNGDDSYDYYMMINPSPTDGREPLVININSNSLIDLDKNTTVCPCAAEIHIQKGAGPSD